MPKSNPTSKAAPPAFSGFTAAGLRFLADLKKNNDREWFNERKEIYKLQVEAPMQALVAAVAEECRARKIPLFAKDRNPVMRVYRDIRFSKDKTPYKTHIAAELRRSFATEGGMLYMHISPEESFAAAGIWQPERQTLQAWRAAMVEDPGQWQQIIKALSKGGLTLESGYSLTVMPRGFQNHEALAPWLKLTSFVTRRSLENAALTSPKLIEAVVSFAAAARPLLEWSWKFERVS